jgi:CRISPR-associated protein Csm3
VRDAPLRAGGELEIKAENVINRRTGTALHPRKLERVAAGAEFALKIGLQIWDLDANCSYESESGQRYSGDDALIEFIKDGLREIQRTGLGSGVSKGSGEVEFRDLALDGKPFTL